MKPEPTHDAHPERSLGTGQPDDVTRPDDQPWCLGCSAPMQGRSCKIRCLRCGYFEDCSNLL